MRFLIATALALVPTLAAAEDWKTLNDNEILQVLTGVHVEYVAARQEFLASGVTIYNTGEKKTGRWSVNKDRYCSSFPPAEITCYTVDQQIEDETRLRFTGPTGKIFNGRIVSLP